ncbi:Receptor-type tyrosine-protein phosphatase beta [Erysiphe neolycopersici]|uniref:Receptor-type tyrosine-protein phosphatase beta n=1 Tax=Erysiphe neolycopersici TaxID=212602 RepID=A0A420HED4_9PEZI|nr:Receptor-type tyrosine-protein phosphatase beta [Erysiphe neolycopersici]
MASERNDESHESLENTIDKNTNQCMIKPDGIGLCNYRLPVFLSLSKDVISQKFNFLNKYEASLAANPSAFLSYDQTKQRNRYANIRPWAHNAIRLKEFEFPENYINASLISLGRNQESFIATQGPGPGDTILHFWQMVWQEKVEVIVMLTQCVEAGREKCSVYLPLQKAENMSIIGSSEPLWGKVECVTQQTEEWGEVRRLRIIKKNRVGDFEERLLYHFLFMRWPDHQVPRKKSDQIALINLLRLSRQTLINGAPEGNIPPRIIHCSAGVGRTGTFIALDHLLQELEEDKLENLEDDKDPIFDTVRRLREQRMGSVNTIQQYALIYQILRERWELRQIDKSRPLVTRGGHKISSV